MDSDTTTSLAPTEPEPKAVPAPLPDGWEYPYSDVTDPDVPLEHLQICFMRLLGVREPRRIAAKLGINWRTVHRVFRHQPNRVFIRQVMTDTYRSQMQSVRKINAAHERAADKLVELLDSEEPRIRLSAIQLFCRNFGLGLTPCVDDVEGDDNVLPSLDGDLRDEMLSLRESVTSEPVNISVSDVEGDL